MNLAEVIRSKKDAVDLGKWTAGHIPRSAFPLSKVRDKAYKFGPAYSWRLVRFGCDGLKCRVLLILNVEKEIFRARLGIEDSGDIIVLCDHEFHGAEPGWHCHFTAKHVEELDSGAVRGNGKRKRPKMPDPAAKFSVTPANAVALAAARYGFATPGILI